ncbi:uncharacterized protein LOC108601502 [Drosophila busckii]|nr:uncharacterized protein LOC108601502 [Drosophila busckii]
MPNSQLLTMHRSDFAEPLFPNVTLRTAPTVRTQSTQTEAPADAWQQLGLEGWTGELKPAVAALELSHTDATPTEITLNLEGPQFNGHVTGIRVISNNKAPQEATMSDLMNVEHVYIARANDPFGYSMKWALRNDSNKQLELERGKRDVAKLYSMIKCSTSCDPLIYKGYGCYCGFGGHGIAVDGIDRCCRQHDKCYNQSNCISYLEYFVPYVWKCYRGKPLCALDHGEWGGPDSCAARLCQCDLQLSRCLRKFYCPSGRATCRSSRSRRLQNLIYFK